MSSKVTLDPYTSSAENTEITTAHKIDGLRHIIRESKTAMMTTKSKDGHLHSRAMTPVRPKKDEKHLNLLFIANNASAKFSEIAHDAHVNVSFYDQSTTDWASISGTARISQDKQMIKEHWNSTMSAYFGDLGDGIHKGNEDDPRISIISVVPEEIRYWFATKGTIGRKVERAVGAMTGSGKAPGELRTINKKEIQLAEELHSQT